MSWPHSILLALLICFPVSKGAAQPPSPRANESKQVELKSAEEENDLLQPVARPLRYDSLLLKGNLELAMEIFLRERDCHDSTALQLIQGHPEWQGAVLVIDWTASMYQQGAQIFGWLDSLSTQNRFAGLVVFNDGDGKYDDEKAIGQTGGIYHSKSCATDSLQELLQDACLGGNGGDHRENDLEALLFAQEQFPGCKRFILIADNRGPIRDLELTSLLVHNFDILLCGVHKGNVRPDYLNLADQTSAKIHASSFVLENIAGQRRTGRIEIEEQGFVWKWGKWAKELERH